MQISRGGWALAVVSLLIVGLLGPGAAGLIRDATGPSFPDALLGVASLLMLAVAGWSLLTVVLVLVGGSSRLITALTPGLLRRALLVSAVGVLVVAPAHAEQQGASHLQHRHSVSGLPLPDRPGIDEGIHPAVSTVSTAIEVRHGDTLWAIAARSLPSGAGVEDIASATTAWHDANRDVIGDDPDLIFPAQQLVPPTGKDHP